MPSIGSIAGFAYAKPPRALALLAIDMRTPLTSYNLHQLAGHMKVDHRPASGDVEPAAMLDGAPGQTGSVEVIPPVPVGIRELLIDDRVPTLRVPWPLLTRLGR